MRCYLAIDIGASSGRHIVGWQEDGEIRTEEIYRFPNGMIELDGHLIWNMESLLFHVKNGIDIALEKFPNLVSLSIDTWGCDYVLLRGDTEVRPCYAYRDHRTVGIVSELHETLEPEELYHRTGCQFQSFNTIYQLYADKLSGRLEGVTDFLMIPEYLMWKLAGGESQRVHQRYHHRPCVALIHQNGNCLDTGFLATPYILDTLCGLGERELALEILWQDKVPSWLYEVDHGATAIWEAWDADEAKRTGRFVSFDHYAFGCVDDWICRHIAGIDGAAPGFGHVRIAPDPDRRLHSCVRSFESEAGKILVDWSEERLVVFIPCNVTATVVWNGKSHEIGSGRYEF